jgi:hypothetical protein
VADAPGAAGGHHLAMMSMGSQHRRPSDDERAFFEAIVVMRGRYATRGRDDALPVTNLHHAIAIANAAMRATDDSEAHRLGTPNH